MTHPPILIPPQELQQIQRKLNYSFKNLQLLEQAFTHCSFVNENKSCFNSAAEAHNERLEFLGDSILGVIIASFLYRHLPHVSEGELSHLRSRLVDSTACNRFIEELEIVSHLRLGKGERNNGLRGRHTIFSDLFEALIGAIYLDGGLLSAEQFFLSHFSTHIHEIISNPVRNFKAELQDYSQRHYQQTPLYTVLAESGPDHDKLFSVAVSIDGKELARAEGASKKEAQQLAAELAIKTISKS